MLPTVLVQLSTASWPSASRCAGWNEVAAVAPLQIAVVCDDGAAPAVETATRELYDAINALIQATGAIAAAPPCGGGGPTPWDCMSNGNPRTQRYLIYVSDGTTSVDPRCLNWIKGSSVVPISVLPPGSNPATILPAPLHNHVVLFGMTHSTKIAALAPTILSCATPEFGGRRVFVSYRHAEAAAIANQLFDRLSRAGYDVFLDRFCGQPGQDFLERIREELVNKRCVVVLETPQVRQSPYVIGEVAAAKRYRLGLMAVDLPGSRRSFRDIAARLDLRGAVGVGNGDPASLLLPADADRVVTDLVNQHYGVESAKRWRHQRRNLQASAARAGLACNETALGLFEISSASKTASAMANACLLDAAAFKRLDDLKPQGVRLLFGPLEAQGRIRRAETTWLERKSTIAARDEGRMLRTMFRLK